VKEKPKIIRISWGPLRRTLTFYVLTCLRSRLKSGLVFLNMSKFVRLLTQDRYFGLRCFTSHHHFKSGDPQEEVASHLQEEATSTLPLYGPIGGWRCVLSYESERFKTRFTNQE
jgi:hypothetical protein